MLVVPEGEEALLFEGEGGGDAVAEASPDGGELVLEPVGEAPLQLVEVVLAGADEAAKDKSGRAAGGGVVALDNAGPHA